MRSIRPTHRRRDDGITVLVFAASASVLLVLGAFVLGGSLGYTAVREAQNSADAAALAATSTLRQVQTGSASPTEVLSTAVSVAADNGADASSVTCEVVTGAYARTGADADVIGACTSTNVQDPDAAGVRVTTGDTRAVPFGSFIGSDTITGDARASATAQPLRQGKAPLMVCGAPTATGHPAPPLVDDASLNPPYRLNPSAVGLSYVVWGNEMKNGGRDCGNGSSSWRGLIRADLTFEMPSPDPVDENGWWQIETGNKTGQVERLVAGNAACTLPTGDIAELTVGCELLLPLCPKGNGQTGVNFRLYCSQMALFRVTYIGGESVGPAPCHSSEKNNIVCADLVGSGVAAVGTGGADTPKTGDVVVVKLVE